MLNEADPPKTDPIDPIEPDEEPDRSAEPVDTEQPPRLPFAVVGIGASAGGLEAFIEFFKVMPADSGLAFVLIQHLPPDRESMLPEILSKHSKMPVLHVANRMAVEPNHVYAIRPGHTLTIKDGLLRLGDRVERPMHSRPVDDFFRSLAEEQRERAICIVMSGMGSNGTAGAQVVKAVGGVCIAQDPESAKFPSMPRSLVDAGLADFVLRLRDIPEVLLRYASHPYTRDSSGQAAPLLAREQKQFKEILAILRTRTRHDFSGYKKPTILRRIQRRMGLNLVTALDEYAKLLRLNPSEVISLSDDMMIHVTGFFRDPEAWDSLQRHVIEPLVAEREPESQVRCWVTACSSGEEAYTLAMLLHEASEVAGKHLDIKIFATDTAERSLSQARNGIFPGGVESEISPERLDRFFERDDSSYRIKRELRELVVFAPQNVLQDPPFSRLDICTCRNLLIYLEPELQQRVLSLLHFGLREGGALMLGSSETVIGSEELFSTIDKRSRIYRRIGPTRHGSIDFPIPLATHFTEKDRAELRSGIRLSISQLTTKLLLDHYTPAAVTIDRECKIVYFHGDTSYFLDQPRGEPTRDLLSITRESVRGAVRTALSKAFSENAPVTVRDGIVDTAGGPRRISVTVSPLESKIAPDFFLVTFEQREMPPAIHPAANANGDEPAMHEELLRVRDELQSTVEELQSSNEEMKASNEEVTSINEELQSTNEELETSKEELQSLNEELATVNSQLQAKMEELQTATSDLTSLLTSTHIAVIFLDTNFRIRRFTPAVKDLMDLIPSDIGRPLNDLARKFVDPQLISDAQQVLDKLAPRENEVLSESGRWYMRRMLPYRTTDNRIDGVVITFVDISARKEAEESLRASEQRHRLWIENIKDYAVFMLDAKGQIIAWNLGAARVYGYTEAEILGRAMAVFYPPEDIRKGVPDEELRVTAAEGHYEGEGLRVRKDGTQFWGHEVINAVHDAAGEMTGFVKVCQDMTDRKRDEDALRASEEQFRLLVEGARDFAMLMIDPRGRIITWNDGAQRLLGYSEAEAIGLSSVTIFTPEDRAAGAPELELATAAKSGTAADDRWHFRKDGTRFWGSGLLTALRAPDGQLRGFVKIMRDETTAKQAETALLEAKAAAERNSRIKDEFLATLSHELRTPLSAILIWVKLLGSNSPNGPELSEGLHAIQASAEAQKQLIDDLLDTSRITSGKLRLEMEDTELVPLVQAAAETIIPGANAKGVRIKLELAPDAGIVKADPDRLRQIIWNLLSNAVRFTDEGGKVTVSLQRMATGIEIRVTDTGKGISPEFLPHVFELFRQADSTTTRTQGGLGLGLAICKQLAELHGGTIAADSPGLGRGATFTVRLPLPTVRRRTRTPHDDRLQIASSPDKARLVGVRILVVEDHKPTRMALSRFLNDAGAKVTHVESAPEALQAYNAERPDLLISDIGLPGEDGYFLIRQIRAKESAEHIDPLPAMALTAFASDEDRQKSAEAGFQLHAGKPVKPEELLDMLNVLLRRE